MKKTILTLIAFYICFMGMSQAIVKPVINQLPNIPNAAKRTPILTSNRLVIPLALSATDTSLMPLIALVNPVPKVELPYLRDFEIYKDTATLVYDNVTNDFLPRIPIPFQIAGGFDANMNDRSAPLDNTIACSKDDHVITVSNTWIEYWKNSTMRFRADLKSFIDYQMAEPCDPKVYFDPTADRFILFLQRCDGAFNKSEILVGFSLTTDPMDGWNFYKLSGNPLNKPNHWFDYPKVGISADGLFISGNIFNGGTAFAQTVVYQIDKSLGFSGQLLRYRVWYDIADSPFTIMPVSYAFNNTYGNGIYMLSTTWVQNADYIKLYDITGSINDPSAQMNFYKVRTTPYNFFAKAVQLNRPLDNGDIRIQDAVFCNNKIHYVFTSGNNRNFSRINFNILEVATLTNKSILLGDKPNYSYAYPSLNIFSEENESTTVFLQYNSTSSGSYPDTRCKTCDDNFNCSQEVVIKAGESIIANYDRWGDYTGIVKNLGSKYQLWLASSYGKNQIRQTYIANIVSFNEAIAETPASQLYSAVSVNFNLPGASDINVVLRSKDKATTIFDGKAEKGESKFEILTNELRKGDYTLEVINKDAKKTVSTFKFTAQ